MSTAHGYHDLELRFHPLPECGEDCELHQYERDDAAREMYRTKSGRIITDTMIEEWAAEAEAGYALDEPVRRGEDLPS